MIHLGLVQLMDEASKLHSQLHKAPVRKCPSTLLGHVTFTEKFLEIIKISILAIDTKEKVRQT